MVSPKTSFTPFRLAAVVLCACAAVTAPVADAQELPARIFLQGNPAPQEGKITGVQGDAILLDLPNGKTSVPLAQVVRVEAAAPPAYAAGIAAYRAASFDKALVDLRPIGDTFRGLPTDWAQRTLAALGDIYLDKNDVPRAEAAFNDYRKFYPKASGSQLQLGVAQARIAFARNRLPQARQALEPVVRAALTAPAEVTRGDGAAYGQAFYLMAHLQEGDKNYQGALENYLRVVTLFYQDAALTARAQKAADDLRSAQKGLSAP